MSLIRVKPTELGDNQKLIKRKLRLFKEQKTGQSSDMGL